jgi:hypothetical protein
MVRYECRMNSEQLFVGPNEKPEGSRVLFPLPLIRLDPVPALGLSTTSSNQSQLYLAFQLGVEYDVPCQFQSDNAAALKLVCAIIHHRNKMVPQTLAAGDILEIAVTADQYDRIDALKFASGNWL